MALDAADKAHLRKVDETAGGDQSFPPQPAFTDGDRELRELQDNAEVERVKAFEETGYVAAPGVGDYHATRRGAKLAGAVLANIGGGEAEDASAAALDAGVRDALSDAHKEAANARRNGGQGRKSGPQGRATRSEMMTGGTSGVIPGAGEGSGKSASTTGTDTTDRTMDASVGSQPPSVGDKPQDSDQDRPSGTGRASGRTGSTGKRSGS
jgi:hypothetical protein